MSIVLPQGARIVAYNAPRGLCRITGTPDVSPVVIELGAQLWWACEHVDEKHQSPDMPGYMPQYPHWHTTPRNDEAASAYDPDAAR